MAIAPRTKMVCYPGMQGCIFGETPMPASLPELLELPDASFYFRGSTALWQGLKLLKVRPGQTILFPSYHCGIELDVVCKGGFHVEFYRVGRDLRIDPGEIRRLARPDIRALYVIHYFGFAQPIGELQQLCAEFGWELIEDCAHAMFAMSDGRPVGAFGDIAIFSLHKSLPVPCGGALVVNNGNPAPPSASRNAPLGLVTRMVFDFVGRDLSRSAFMNLGLNRRLVPWLSQRIRNTLNRSWNAQPHGEPISAVDFHKTWEDARMPGLTRWLLRRICRDRVVQRRRSNFAVLLQAATGCNHIVPLLGGLANGACPGFFPVTVSRDPAQFVEYCYARGVRTHRLWPQFHKAFPASSFPESVWLKQQVVVLPVHQDLTDENLAELQDLIRSWEQLKT